MGRTAISARNLGKCYLLGASAGSADSLREVLAGAARGILRSNKPARATDPGTIWALRDVSFDIAHGEVVGVIGRNGAGKSTLLKLLSRITQPSEGEAFVYGRVGSLLEVGTGFHQDLTGRENIYLNGAILGMDKAYIDKRFDEIVAFSEVERFIDTPVKRYSSGMYLRLAFAVAAHLEAEVLMVDEVLAVGDAEFQRKCIGKMSELTGQGRTVLFVSHNMAAVQGLCHRTLLIDGGKLAAEGETNDVIARYLALAGGGRQACSVNLSHHERRRPGSEVIVRSLSLESEGLPTSIIRMGAPAVLRVEFARTEPIPFMRFAFAIENALGQRLFVLSPTYQEPALFPQMLSSGAIVCRIPSLPLTPGSYYVTIILSSSSSEYLDRIDQAVQFSVEAADVFGTGYAPGAASGVFYLPSSWELAPAEPAALYPRTGALNAFSSVLAADKV